MGVDEPRGPRIRLEPGVPAGDEGCRLARLHNLGTPLESEQDDSVQEAPTVVVGATATASDHIRRRHPRGGQAVDQGSTFVISDWQPTARGGGRRRLGSALGRSRARYGGCEFHRAHGWHELRASADTAAEQDDHPGSTRAAGVGMSLRLTQPTRRHCRLAGTPLDPIEAQIDRVADHDVHDTERAYGATHKHQGGRRSHSGAAQHLPSVRFFVQNIPNGV
jgi:hypothetical protein